MSALIMAGLCAGIGMGILLVVHGVRGNRILPELGSLFPDGTSTAVATAWLAAALVVGTMVVAVTRWIGAGIGVAGLVIAAPWFLGGSRINRREIEKTQAIATWAEMIRDNIAGSAGLEQALLSTADIAPLPIAREVRRFANRLDGRSMNDALVLLGKELDHPSADLVVVSLANAARMEGRDFGPLLTRLSESIRADVRMRLRVEVGRARIRTSSKIVLGVTIFTIVMIYFTSRELLDVYNTTNGQFWLLGVFALFIASLWLMNYYAQIRLPERFSARTIQTADEGLAP